MLFGPNLYRAEVLGSKPLSCPFLYGLLKSHLTFVRNAVDRPFCSLFNLPYHLSGKGFLSYIQCQVKISSVRVALRKNGTKSNLKSNLQL